MQGSSFPIDAGRLPAACSGAEWGLAQGRRVWRATAQVGSRNPDQRWASARGQALLVQSLQVHWPLRGEGGEAFLQKPGPALMTGASGSGLIPDFL
ncbi:hypothetical protein CAY53_07330 [Desulfobulbus oralis]|uniref:Uncharacterized protein n=1 Tax=Desulfobulbus oralis TaxID=1986146 RepID=A0A2L1GNT8_9BACT|nr:hypothetical protein CAY53_07330 [Desulfobulbus oralis]